MKHLNTVYLPVEEMNQLFAYCKTKKRLFLVDNPSGISHSTCCVIKEKRTRIEATTEFKGVVAHYITFLDGREDPQTINGGQAYATLKCSWPQIPEIPEDDTIYEWCSAGPMIDYNETYEGQRIPAWGYDLNSAYASVMLKGWIDASVPPQQKVIDPETEIGFTFDLEIQRTGNCPFVFKKMETPEGVKKWVERYYTKKKEAKNKIEKLIAKQTLTYAVGMLQKKNPWLRAWIVAGCNEYISSLLDENSLFWNTDSIVSRVPRPDLELGDDIGQWKLEHEGVVAYKGNTYQWNNDKPTYRGVPKTWFNGDFDLLKDAPPKNQNLYYFNKKEIQIYGKDTIQ